ncbi:Abortive infection protein [Desulfosarcina cetonica]|uniref:CPBP family intramembrane glutamic endopeptidase n=1 Tax=Desulfosarcina cetonica TaxID=90730 RepID=UPI0006CF69B7|nr:type II CAAX endopeptidase family protein [Desulfosarcina cetonica]VTR71485.1 Abortive infection protein [Desulfosarcina cetonica]
MGETDQSPFVLGEANLKADTTGSNFPDRYAVKEVGPDRVLTCLEAPNLQVIVKAGMTVATSAVRKAAPGTIYLDGVAQAEPFLDHERKVYNLDHHEGCVRAFTLSTCEQALIMCVKGLDLRDREWKIFANEPDLDTVLAIWIILNHQRVNNREAINRRALFALVRLEGVIDSLGLELRELTALPAELMQKLMRVIDRLRADELDLKKAGEWTKTDFIGYTMSVLRKLDQFLIKVGELDDFKGVEELARVELTNNRIAVVVASDLGIYELEPHLTKLYGNRLGWVALRKDEKTYTLRQMDLFMPVNLEDVYQRLNYMDPAVKGRMGISRWGGSGDIGGSPRDQGTKLTPAEIASACRDVIEKRSDIRHIKRFLVSAGYCLLILLAAIATAQNWLPMRWFGLTQLSAPIRSHAFGFYAALLVVTALTLFILAFRRPWQFGLMLPAGKDWWRLLPLAVVCGLTGGMLAPDKALFAADRYLSWAFALILIPLSLELLFRGLIHGMMAQLASIQDSESRWFFSGPTIGAALLYALAIGIQGVLLSPTPMATLTSYRLLKHIAVAGFFGIGAGMIRERSHSILIAWLFHALAVATMLLVYGVV